MLSVTKQFRFEAAHNLPFYDGKCSFLHGHSYLLEVTVTGKINNDKYNPKNGMIIDFSDLKAIVNECVIEKVDHANLNDMFVNPTAEIMVTAFYHTISEALPVNMKLVRCRLWETVDSYAEYGED